MSKRGPLPKSPEEKLAMGNPSKRPLSFPKPPKDPAAVARPKFLKGRAAKIWDLYAPELIKIGTLTPIRAHQFALYCTLAAELEAKGGDMMASRMTQMNSLAGSFGMNGDPRLVPAAGSDKPKDPAEKYF